jgi:hypothetical protein
MATKEKRQSITANQFRYLMEDCRQVINSYIEANSMSVHGFATLCGVHPNQLYLFLKGDRGLNLTTMQKIGEIISK